MSLVKCDECGRKISDTARLCPHCGAKIKKGISGFTAFFIVVGIFIFLLIIISVSKKNGNDARLENIKGNDSNISILSAIKSDKKLIKFEVLRQWDIPENGFGMEILVDKKATKEEVVILAKSIRNHFLSKNRLVVSIFDLKEAWANRSNDNYPESKYFKHYLVEMVRNKNTGYDEIQWTAKGRDY